MTPSGPLHPSPDDEGRFLVELRAEPIDLAELGRFVSLPECGGTAFFVGSVRPDDTELGVVEHIDYEAYGGVAEAKILEIAGEAHRKFGAERVAVLHRIGRCLPGEPSVMVAAACGHRAEAFDACRYVIDELKVRVPIWKREVAGGGARWVRCDHEHGDSHGRSLVDEHGDSHEHEAGNEGDHAVDRGAVDVD